MNNSVKYVLRPSKLLANGKNILFLRITINRKTKHYSLGTQYACYLKDWDANNEKYKKSFENSIESNAHLKSEKGKANRVLIDLDLSGKEYSIHDFDNLYKIKPNSLMLLSYFDEVIEKLSINNYGNSRVFKETRNSLKRFLNSKLRVLSDYPLTSIDVKFLKKYEAYLREPNPKTGKPSNADTSISIRMRTLRRLFNIAIEETNLSNYPFANYTLKHLNKKTKKRALKADDLKRILDFELDKESRKYKSLQYFKFMFYTRGMNFSDIALLKKIDINNGTLNFNRAKGHREYSFPIVPQALDIIDFFNNEVFYSQYVFPILTPHHITPAKIKDRIKSVLKKVNDDLREISKDAGVNVSLTSYYTRHSFATILKYQNVPIAKISELLGHENIETTQIYLDGFEYDELNQVVNDMYSHVDNIKVEKTSKEKALALANSITSKLPWLKDSENPLLDGIQSTIEPNETIVDIDGNPAQLKIDDLAPGLSLKSNEALIDLLEKNNAEKAEEMTEDIKKIESEEKVLEYLATVVFPELILNND